MGMGTERVEVDVGSRQVWLEFEEGAGCAGADAQSTPAVTSVVTGKR